MIGAAGAAGAADAADDVVPGADELADPPTGAAFERMSALGVEGDASGFAPAGVSAAGAAFDAGAGCEFSCAPQPVTNASDNATAAKRIAVCIPVPPQQAGLKPCATNHQSLITNP